MYFTVGLISSIVPSIKVTRHRIVWLREWKEGTRTKINKTKQVIKKALKEE
jgi:hypothetical protein